MKEVFGLGIHGKYGAGKDYVGDLIRKNRTIPLVQIAFGDVLKEVCSCLVYAAPLKSEAFQTQEKKDKPIEFYAPFAMTNRIMFALSYVLDEHNLFDGSGWREKGPYFGGKKLGEIFDIMHRELSKYIHCDEKEENMRCVPPMSRGKLLQVVGTDIFRRHIHEDAWVWVVESRIARYKSMGIPWIVTDVRFPNEIEMIRRQRGFVVRIEAPTLTEGTRDHTHPSETACDHIELPTFNNDRSDGQNQKLLEICAAPLHEVISRMKELPMQKSRFFKET